MAEYKVIQDYSKENFESTISTHLSKGWQLVGGVALAEYANEDTDGKTEFWYYQALSR
jgi:hypothetical protein